jgi:tetratricopeptide (TPR) repeat protein
MRTKAMIAFLAGILMMSFAANLGLAQAGRGTARLTGVVLGPSGNPVEGAQVTLNFGQGSGATKRETKTNKKGEWSFMGLEYGQWQLVILAKGCEAYTQSVHVSQLELNPLVEVTLKKSTSGGVIQDESTLDLLDLGNKYYNDGEYDKAISQFQLFLASNPQAYQVQLNIADCYRQKGDYDQATKLYNEVIQLSASDNVLGKEVAGKAEAGIGDIYLKQNKLSEAQEYFQKSIESVPNDEILAYNVGEIYFSNQNLAEAKKYFELAARIKPNWPDSYLKLGYVYLNELNNDEAVKMFEKFLTLEPQGERAALVQNILKTIKK